MRASLRIELIPLTQYVRLVELGIVRGKDALWRAAGAGSLRDLRNHVELHGDDFRHVRAGRHQWRHHRDHPHLCYDPRLQSDRQHRALDREHGGHLFHWHGRHHHLTDASAFTIAPTGTTSNGITASGAGTTAININNNMNIISALGNGINAVRTAAGAVTVVNNANVTSKPPICSHQASSPTRSAATRRSTLPEPSRR
jgi:hypothetical protein